MRTTTAGMAAHLAQRSHTRCKMLLLELDDGTALGITDHNKDLDFDLGGGSETYLSGTGIKVSNIAMSCGLDADNYEVIGPVREDGAFTLEALLGGRFRRARASLFEVNWRKLSDGALKLVKGNAGEIKIEGGEFVFEVRSDKDRLNQVVGRILSNQCDADFGDARCTLTPEEVVGTVTAATSALVFTVSYSGSYADDFYNKGTVHPLTGDLANTRPVPIEDWNDHGDGTATITLFMPLVGTPEVGDTFTVRQGCFDPATGETKTRAACMHFANMVNFRGFPDVPGSDQVLKPAIPGQGSAAGAGGKGK